MKPIAEPPSTVDDMMTPTGTRLEHLFDGPARSPVTLIVDRVGALKGYVEVAHILSHLLSLDDPNVRGERT